jgi:potassium-dependent mechanosensitive channel
MADHKSARFLFSLALAMLLFFASIVPISAQTNFSTGSNSEAADAAAPLDYDAWEKFASSADRLIGDPTSSDIRLETLRSEIASWREKFLAAQGTNAARLTTIRSQIDALGPAPAEGATEAKDIAARRVDLNKQLGVLQAPSIAAVEAYSRADGLIREIDGVVRERQTDAFLQLWPTPLNPAAWPAALESVLKTAKGLTDELTTNWQNETKRATALDKLPPIVLLLLFSALTILRGRALIESLAFRLLERGHSSAREIWAFVASLGQIVVPTLGVLAFSTAAIMSGMLGPLGEVVAGEVVVFGAIVFIARWIGSSNFPRANNVQTVLRMPTEARAKGRFLAQALGLVLGFEVLRKAFLPDSQLTEASNSVLSFPTIVVAGYFLYRMGKLLLRNSEDETKADDLADTAQSFATRLISLIARASMIVAVIGPFLAVVGYIPAALGLVFPMIASLGLIGLLLTLQNQVGAIYSVIIRSDTQGRDALVPVLIGFFLSFASAPFFALIWGARVADLTEVFTKMRDGFQIGETRISPSDYILLAVVFGFWFLVTRLLQGALKSTILPKTSLDQGGQNAIVAGVGYIGIFLAALIGVTAAGIDLSGLAIVAGALSVGIGFGMQNIVSNFVAGIILLIERPISEGDWIEVNGVMGTVSGISVRSTRIQTFDRTDVIVPNSDFVSGMVTNWTRFNLSGRLILKVGVAYGTDTRKVEAILKEIAEAQPLAVLNPPPNVLLVAFGADSLDFEIRLILRDVNFSMAVRSEMNHEIARRFAEEGIEIPFGQRDIWLRNPEKLAQMVAPLRQPDEPLALAEPEGDTRPADTPRKEV